MEIDIIDYTSEQYVLLSTEQILEVRAAQEKKNKLENKRARSKLFYRTDSRQRIKHRLFVLTKRRFLLHYYHHCRGKQNEHAEVEGGEQKNVFKSLFRIMLCVFAEGYKTCERGDKSSYTAYVYPDQKRGVVVCELREQYRRGNVAYALAGENAEEQGVLLKKP